MRHHHRRRQRRFGQPEIKLGIIPGAGGTQRLPRAIGKAKAMDMILTARMMDAAEAERAGLVSRVVPAAELIDEALAVARDDRRVRRRRRGAGQGMRQPRLRSRRCPTAWRYERRVFHALFATADQKEGMAAFVDKRKAAFTHR